jgi:hypothetical protein
MGFLSSSIGDKVDEMLFKNQKAAIILNFILVLLMMNFAVF